MREGDRAGKLVTVIVQKPVRVALEINRTRSTISGQLAVDGAPAHGFYGWLELLDQLGRAVGAGVGGTEPPQVVRSTAQGCDAY